MGQVGNVYASAIFELAKEENRLEELNDDMKALYEIFKSENDLANILETPVISPKEKKELLEKLFKGKVCEDIFNFMKLIVDKGRMNSFRAICEAFFELYREDLNILLAEVYTIEELDEDLKVELTRKLSELTGSKIEIKQIIDDTLLGGIRIKIGSHIIDSSVIFKLNKLGDSLREVSL